KRDFSSAEAYNKSIEPNRQRLAKILGVVDPRVPFDAPELVGTTKQARSASEGHPLAVGKGENYDIFAVRWPAVRDVNGEGLLLVPKGKKVADIIAIPDADQTPEQICGLAEGVPPESQFARRLAENGCRVLVPVLIDRKMQRRAPPGRQGGANLSNREYLYRPAFELGRHLIGYEVQKVLAGVDWFAKEAGDKDAKIGVIGYGEGGMLALYAGALDTRIDATCVSGYFSPRESIWEQPIDRNVFGLLEQFGDAELAAMICFRSLRIEADAYPVLTLPSEGGAPAILKRPESESIESELSRRQMLATGVYPSFVAVVLKRGGEPPPFALSNATIRGFFGDLLPKVTFAESGKLPEQLGTAPMREQRQQHEIEEDTQELLRESPFVREQFMKKLYDCPSLEEYSKVVEEYREIFAKDVIGRFDYPLMEANPRSRKSYDTEKWVGYEVVLDVFPDVFAYGILCLPKDLKPGEKRPVVVCQHGLEGRPQDTIGEQGSQYYSAFAGKLADRGFITFAPQNIYIGKDLFRTLQRKANPLGKTLFSIMVPQHQQIVNWLKEQPFVDGERIAFYGLSYGGKSAMRIPPLVPDYCLSICSADFNEWVAKNASTRLPFSYVWTGEYEIFEFDLGSTFNYSEMAALICPRPFMVERGHTDGVSEDHWVAFEYAKVFFNYSHRLKIPDRCELEIFDGPHKINGVATYAFLHKHLNWPEPK
ncbi:MAG TPA: dienelactone hydrolase family protein, partial [Pirellulaceae bacterium]|nr:dienelactone hydrolase family protein [Pirellulaceae bacterium]